MTDHLCDPNTLQDDCNGYSRSNKHYPLGRTYPLDESGRSLGLPRLSAEIPDDKLDAFMSKSAYWLAGLCIVVIIILGLLGNV